MGHKMQQSDRRFVHRKLLVYILENSVPAYSTYFSDVNISQGNLATPLRFAGTCNDPFIANFQLNVTVKEC